jgi:hypothetical protein
MKRSLNIQNNIHRVVYYLSITILMCGGIIFMFSSTDAIAETKQACQRDIAGMIEKLGVKPSREGYAKAMRYCQAGDKRSAMRVLKADSGAGGRKQVSREACERELTEFSKRSGAQPSKTAYQKALRYCQAGDKRSAMRVLRADIGAGQRKQVSMEECERKLTQFSKRSGAKPSKIAYHKALRYCQAGDMSNAYRVLKADRESGSKKKMSKKECKDKINQLCFKSRFIPSKEAYSKAVSQCQAGDMRSAHRVLKVDNESGSKKKVSKAWCKEYLKVSSSRLGVETSKKSFSKALGYCQQRDLKKARNVLIADK